MFYLNNNPVNKIMSNEKLLNFKMLPDDSYKNKIPYVSTYWYEPRLNLGDKLNIHYYVTDYFQSDYSRINPEEQFTIVIEIMEKTKVLKSFSIDNVKIGDGSYVVTPNLPVGDYLWTIQAIDSKGLESYKVYNHFMIYDKMQYEQNLLNHTHMITDEELLQYNINKNCEYGAFITIPVPQDTVDVLAYLKSYADTLEVESGHYIAVLGDTNNDGYYEQKTQNWFRYTEGDYQGYIKYASDYNFESVEAEAKANVVGLQRLIDDKIRLGVKKLIMPKGYYRVTTTDVIEVYADNFVLDWNNSTIKSNELLEKKSSHMMSLRGYNSKIINCNFIGCVIETDYSKWKDDDHAQSWFELLHGVSITYYSEYCSYENCAVKDINGYGLVSSKPLKSPLPDNSGNNGIDINSYKPKFNIPSKWTPTDIVNGKEVPSSSRLTYDYVDVTPYGDYPYITFSHYLGYQNRSGGSWNYTCHMYDSDKNYLGYEICTQYRKHMLKPNTAYVRITVHTSEPKYIRDDGSELESNSIYNAYLNTIHQVICCYFKDINVENIRCVGYCPAGKNSWAENVHIKRSGYAEAHQGVDIEDTWENLQDFTFKYCSVKEGISYSSMLWISGLNVIAEDCEMDFSVGERCRDFCLRTSKVSYCNISITTWLRNGYIRVSQNTFNGSTYGGFENTFGNYEYDQVEHNRKLIIDDTNTIKSGVIPIDRGKQLVFKNHTIECNNRESLAVILATYENCTVNNIKNGFASCRATSCTFNDCNGDIRGSYNMYGYDSKFVNCTFNRCSLVNKTKLTDKELFINCTFNE